MGTAAQPSPTTRVGFVMESEPRIPLQKGEVLTIDRAGRAQSRKKKNKPVRFPREDCEFYTNIWTPPPHSVAILDVPQRNTRFIDISQVAYALTRIDYKNDYEGAEKADGKNLWTMNILELELDPVELPPLFDEQGEHDEASTPSTVCRMLSQGSNRSQGPPSEHKTLDRLLSMQGTSNVRSLPVPPPSKHDGARFIFSAVLSQVELRDLWSSKFLLGLHEPVRHALYVIDRFLEQAQATDKAAGDWNTATFFAWFGEYFCEYIQAQQRIKANVLRPLLQVKYAAKKEIAECYDEITSMMNAIMAQEHEFPVNAASAATLWQARLLTLQEDIRKLNVVLYHVLNLEERALQPALIATFNEDTFYKFVMPRVFSAARPKRLVIPWIIERSKVWGSEDDVSMFKKQLSFSSRFLYDRVWYPFFARNVVAAMRVLDTSLVEMPSDGSGDSWFGCVIQ